MRRHFRSVPVTAAALLVLGNAAVLPGCGYTRSAPANAGAEEEEGSRSRPADVTARDIEGRYGTRIEHLLEGRVPGVRVVRTAGGGISIRMLGGPSSFYGDGEPLYVVDGMQVHVTQGQGLDWLNPGDIESIRVVRDASGLSFYGSRGANGVILITTRRGSR